MSQSYFRCVLVVVFIFASMVTGMTTGASGGWGKKRSANSNKHVRALSNRFYKYVIWVQVYMLFWMHIRFHLIPFFVCDQSFIQSVGQSVNQSVSWPVSQSVSQSLSSQFSVSLFLQRNAIQQRILFKRCCLINYFFRVNYQRTETMFVYSMLVVL